MKWVLGIIAVIVLAIYGYVRLHVYSQTFEFRMTMTVSTPEGEKSASSVIAVYLPRDMRPQGVTGIVRGTIYGIAPIIDLGRYGTLIASLKSNPGDPEARRLSPTGNVRGKDADDLVLAAYGIPDATVNVSKAWHGGKRELGEDHYPQIIWIPPGAQDPDLARAFHSDSIPQMINADVQIVSITIEPTRDPLIERILIAPGWLRTMRTREASNEHWERSPKFFNFYLNAVETARPSTSS